MSFILDALRKSEADRRRAEAPALAGIPIEATRSAIPGWTRVVIAVLAITVIGLGGAWWNSVRMSDVSEQATDQRVAVLQSNATSAAPVPVGSNVNRDLAAAEPATERRAAPTAEFPELAAATGAVTDIATDLDLVPALPSAAAQAPDTGPGVVLESAGSARGSSSNLPTIASLIAEGVQLPDLKLELLVYHADSTARWVYVNGGRYKEGQRTSFGPWIVEIRPEGVVLNHAGRDFMLFPQ
jgi:general secretion pathway protein B